MCDFQDVKRDPAVRYLRRVAVAQAGAGFGRRLLSALIDWVFAATAAERVTLHVRKINTRAQHVYRSLGFVEDNSACEPDELAWMLPKSDWIAR
ncbi:MAG: GNAT family N-acetyltransferase [Rhizomicrobium sp.]